MNLNRMSILIIAILFSTYLTGCYTQVATSDSESIPDSEEYTESSDYFSEDEETVDSGYFSETETDSVDSETTIINNYYYGYPYRSYFVDYYPTITLGIAFGWSWGWYWGYYYPAYYYPYWTYYPGWCGYGWYYPYPYYCYYPSYYYCSPYYYPTYYSYGYPYYNYGYKTRNENISRIRNNSGGRNYGERTRDPLVSVTGGTIDRKRNLSEGRDLEISRKNVTDRRLGSENKNRDLTRDIIGTNEISRNKVEDTKNPRLTETRDKRTLNDINSDISRNLKQLSTDKGIRTKKSLGNNQRNDISKQLGTRNNITKTNNDIKRNSVKDNKTYSDRNNSKNNTIKKSTTTKQNNTYKPRDNRDNGRTKTNKTYSPPKQNNNPPKSYSPPKQNNNPPRSYNPPRNNTPPRTNSTPNRSGGNNSGGRRR